MTADRVFEGETLLEGQVAAAEHALLGPPYGEGADKLDVLEAPACEDFAILARQYESIRARARDPIERLRLISHTYLDYARANPELFRMMFLFAPQSPEGGGIPPGAQAFRSAASSVEEAIAAGRCGRET